MIHGTPLDAVQLQPVALVTATNPAAAAASTDAFTGEIAYVHATPSCVIVTVRPATVSVAFREEAVVFAATAYATVPLPLPAAPETMVTHGAELPALHAQPAPVVTDTDPVVAAAGTVDAVGDTAKLQPAACVTVNGCPAIVSVAVRAVAKVFAAIAYATFPLPLPAAPEVTVNQPESLAAVHAQPAVADTITVPVVDEGPTDTLTGARDAPHWAVKTNVFEGVLVDPPSGPMATTRASCTTPGAGHDPSNGVKFTLIFPSG